MLKYILLFFFIVASLTPGAQTTLSTRYTTAASRAKLYKNLIQKSINKNLSIPLTDSTTERWEDAFSTLGFLNYRSAWIDGKVIQAIEFFPRASDQFRQATIELLYTNYRSQFTKNIAVLSNQVNSPKIFAMCMEYLLADTTRVVKPETLIALTKNKFPGEFDSDPVLKSLLYDLGNKKQSLTNKMLKDLFAASFLPGRTILYSIQRKNRDYPGLAIIRDRSGRFLATDTSSLFYVPHFARSVSSLPSYISNGNTPQGIFRITGFGVSTSEFIGPSVNLQMCMPVECSIAKFLNDANIWDTIWTEEWYAQLLPASLRNYFPLYGSYYAGAAGRTEIIAHGTAVDPKYYAGKPYYPHTPSAGCLTTSEIWDDNGRRIASNQQKLVDAMLKVGGADGYCVVIELPDGNGPVKLSDIAGYLSQ